MTRTSSISGTFVKRQRSPVSVAAASSLSAAFLLPLIGHLAAQRPAAVDAERLALDRQLLVLPVERTSVGHVGSAARARTLAVAALGDADAQQRALQRGAGAGQVGRLLEALCERPLGLAARLARPSRGRSRRPGRPSRP